MLQDYEAPSGGIAKQIEADFGSLDKLIPIFNAKTAAIQVCNCKFLLQVLLQLCTCMVHHMCKRVFASAVLSRLSRMTLCACIIMGRGLAGAGWAGASNTTSSCTPAHQTRILCTSRYDSQSRLVLPACGLLPGPFVSAMSAEWSSFLFTDWQGCVLL